MINEYITEAMAVLAQLASANQTAAAHAVGPFNTQVCRQVLFIVDLGALGASATVDFKVQASATQAGTYADVANSSITQITAGATNLVLVLVRHETLAAAGVGPWIKGVLTVGTAASQAGVVALGFDTRFKPGSDYNLVTPAQTLVV